MTRRWPVDGYGGARQAVARFPAERLDGPLAADSLYTAYTQLIGLTQHGLHHAGRIAILKRALERP